MIRFLKGALAIKSEGKIVIETAGVGFEVFVPENSILLREREGAQICVFTAMMVKEDGISLYGFPDDESLALFHKLITVSGVGAKAATALLSIMPPRELSEAIVFGDAAMLARANGVGKKTAERIILELKDKVQISAFAGSKAIAYDREALAEGAPRGDAVEALTGLGYTRSEAVIAVASVQGDDLTTEEYIRQALKSVALKVK
ncbi:MAG: Holliday junction branch migration protein RuvA [Clostridiales Family XIII bacterium]|jgi:Holliday junction DNA helicase RuvA|nr:Holliday junction branch migration protein RuvA [Clostridiales Family XIII bacterium]